jgi:transcriptional regulator with XRE-family HTH domain
VNENLKNQNVENSSREYLKTMGNKVRCLRIGLSMSQEKLAEISCLHPTYISGIERGLRNPTILSARRISKALNCKISDLCDDI